MTDRFEELAQALATAWRKGGTVALPPAAEAPASRAEAFQVQDRMAQILADPVAGWKVGATVKAVQQFEGHDGPVPGRIFADRLYQGPARIPSRLYRGAKVECEFAFRLKGDLKRTAAPVSADALAPLLTFHPAIELAATRYAPGTGNRAATTYDGIADNGTSGAVVLGEGIEDWQSLPFETMEIDGRIDDSPPMQAYSGPYRRHPLAVAAETFTELMQRGVDLHAGTCLLTGSLTLPTAIRPGQTFVVRFAQFKPISMTFEKD